jgi:phosphohistidine swiveling domain-containing protein
MGMFLRACLSLFLFVCFGASAQQASDAAWCGNKHKNLVILRDIVQGMPNVEVPAFLGISSDRVEKFLRQHAASIFTDYTRVCDLLMREMSPGKLNQFIAPLSRIPLVGGLLRAVGGRQRTTNIAPILQRIQDQVKSCFREHGFSFTSEEEQFFACVAQQGKFFMVRSTGVEDSQTVANAGGNVSVAYVKPDVQEISRTMGEVVASYFGEQSIKNRLAGGESLELCLPVLIQELIGEKRGGAEHETDIPVSGVAFTTRASLSSPGFSLMEINAAYGHGEGVVANRVCTDRYYVTQSKMRAGEIMIYPAIRKKSERLVPGTQESPALKMHKNSHEAALRSALSPQQLKHMYAIFRHIETAYGQPMDIEFVVRGTILFIVQARPAMHHDMKPSYCRHENIPLDQCTIVAGNTLVLGAAQAIVVQRASDIIITNTLDEADQHPQSTTCKAVIVKEWASPLSHAAVNFTGRGVPCVCVSDLQAVRRAVRSVSPSRNVIIDPQRGCIVTANVPRNRLLQYIMPGWFEHPAENVLSTFSDDPLCTAAYITPIPQDGKLVALLEQFKSSQDRGEQRQLFEQIVARITARCKLTDHRMKLIKNSHDLLQKNFLYFKNTLEDVIGELRAALGRNADRFEVLFYHKMLEALVYQQNDRKNVVNGFTYTYFLNELFVRQHIYRFAEQHGVKVVCSEELGYASLCPDRELASHWIACVQELMRLGEHDQYDLTEMKSLLADIHEMGSLPMWFATEFYRMVKSCATKSPADITQVMKVYVSQERQHADMMKKFKHIKSLMSTLKESCAHPYATYAAAKSVWQQIDTEIISFISDEKMLRTIKGASSMVQLIACDLFVQIIDLIDTSMKNLKISAAISLNDKINQFEMMLRGFHRCCNALMHIAYNSSYDLGSYMADVQTLLDFIVSHSVDASMFQRSNTFSVQAALFSSKTAFNRHRPQTAEDMFMLLHQNSLSSVAQWYVDVLSLGKLSEAIFLPQILHACIAFIDREAEAILQPYRVGKPGLVGIQYEENYITILYNMPLSNHSSTFQIIYDAVRQQCRIEVQFLGEARIRWKQVEILAALSEDLSGLHGESPAVLDERAGIVSWGWALNTQNLPVVFEYLGVMGGISFGDRLTLDTLRALFRGSRRNELRILQAAVRAYQRTKGINKYTLNLAKSIWVARLKAPFVRA